MALPFPLPGHSSRFDLSVQVSRPYLPPNHKATVDVWARVVPGGASAPPHVPIALCLVIDCSKSMRGQPLQAAKGAAEAVLQNLAPTDYVALISFNRKARLAAPLWMVNDGAHIRRAIRRLRAKSTTALHEATRLAIETMRNVGGPVPRILVLTDGYPTDVTVPEEYRALGAASFRMGLPIGTIGFGLYNDRILRALSDVAGGWWEHARDLPSISNAFREEARKARGTVLRRPLLHIRLPAGAVLREAHFARPIPRVVDPAPGYGGLFLEIPDLVVGVAQEYAFRLEIPPQLSPGSLEAFRLTLTDRVGNQLASQSATVDYARDTELVGYTEPRPTAVYGMTVALEKGTLALELGDPELAEQAKAEARAILNNPRLRGALNAEEEGKTRVVEESSTSLLAGAKVDTRESISRMRKG